VPFDPAYKAGLAGHVPASRRSLFHGDLFPSLLREKIDQDPSNGNLLVKDLLDDALTITKSDTVLLFFISFHEHRARGIRI
jgi:hypothetical protein